MSKKSLSPVQGKALFESVLCNAEQFPISFTYDGVSYRSFAGLPCLRFERSDIPGGAELNAAWQVDKALTVRIAAKYNSEYAQSEYTVFFENPSDVPSKVLTGIAALDHQFAGEAPILRGILGYH